MGSMTEIGYATVDDIYIRGLNIAEKILDEMDFVDLIYLLLTGKKPEQRTKGMLNALLITGSDHGLTPSSISARLTFHGAPEALQGAVASGLLGAGNHLLGAMQTCTELLTENIGGLTEESSKEAFLERADSIIDTYKKNNRPITGMGHPIHVNGDPRTPKLRVIAEKYGYYGRHWMLMDAICEMLKRRGKNLPLNGVGAYGSCVADMGLDPRIGRGLAIIGRAAGLLGHILEESRNPTGQRIWDLVVDADKA